MHSVSLRVGMQSKGHSLPFQVFLVTWSRFSSHLHLALREYLVPLRTVNMYGRGFLSAQCCQWHCSTGKQRNIIPAFLMTGLAA